jgi:hypothetical protein
MATELQRESTEYVYVGVTGDAPSAGVELAFMQAGDRPDSGDWLAAILVDSAEHALWADAVAAVGAASYYAAILIGAYGGTGEVLAVGDYQPWLRATDTIEQPVRIVPVALEIA